MVCISIPQRYKFSIKIPRFRQNIKDLKKIKNVFAFKKIPKVLKNIVDFFLHFYLRWINIGLYFYTVRIQTQYQNTRFSSKHKKKYIYFPKNGFCFKIRPSLSNIYIYINIITSYFHTTKEIFKTIYVLACILALITSLFKP